MLTAGRTRTSLRLFLREFERRGSATLPWRRWQDPSAEDRPEVRAFICRSSRLAFWGNRRCGEMADAQDLKSWDPKKSCEFESHHRHQPALVRTSYGWQTSRTSVAACPLTLFNPLGHVFKMGNFGLRRQAERDAALEKDRTLIHPAKALSSLRFASAVQMCHPCLATWAGGIRGIPGPERRQGEAGR